MDTEVPAGTQQRPEPDISNHRGPGQRAVDLLKSAAIHAAGLLVLAIFLATVVFPFPPGGMRRSEDAKIKAAQTQLQSFQQALLAYIRDNRRPPTTEQGLTALIERPTNHPRPHSWQRYLDIPEVPKDPWGNDYLYASPGPYGEPWVIRSYAKDGAPGGKGHAADLALDYLDAVEYERSRR